MRTSTALVVVLVSTSLLFALPAGADDDWKKTGLGKAALKTRPAGHPEGKPWVKLWKDDSPSNEAKPLGKKLKAKDENKTCNGLDDDKDGKIDEKCGMKSGGFQATIAWDSHASIDIQVIYSPWDYSRHEHDHGKHRLTYGYDEKSKNEVFIGQGRKKISMKLQGDSKGSCACNARYVNGKVTDKDPSCKVQGGELWAPPNKYVENAYLASEKALPGIYSINFYNHSKCELGRQDQTRVNLGVSVNGKTIGHYRSGDLGQQGFSFPILKVYVPPEVAGGAGELE